MTKSSLVYLIGALAFATGIACSFLLARFVDSSLALVEEQVYIDESTFFTERCFSLFEATSLTTGLVEALGLINVTKPEDFDTLSEKQAGSAAISRVNLVRRINPSLADSAANDIGGKYNTTIDLIYITDRDIEGDLFLLEYVFPRAEDILGLVFNSEESRAYAIDTAVQSGEPTFLDNVVLADTGELGRLGFYPVISSSWPFINILLNMVIRYNALFEPLVLELETTFPNGDVEIFVHGTKVFDSNLQDDLGDNNSKRFTSSVVDILVSNFDNSGYSDVFFYMLVSGVVIVTSLAVLILLNGYRVRAERYSNLKSRFIAAISHEIRTPMNGILGMAELLAETNLAPTPKYYVKTISSCGAILMVLINDILDMSKIQAGVLEIKQDTVNVQQVVKTSVDNIWAAYMIKDRVPTTNTTNKKLEAILEFTEGIPEKIVGDGFRIQQVLSNLLTNSLKFTDDGFVKIVVSCVEGSESEGRTRSSKHKIERYIRVSVQDTGCGMTPQQSKEAFRAFNQAHGRTDLGGAGLGLSISKKLCGLMGGDIVCSSTLGVGTTVIFTVQAKNTPETDTTASPLRIVYRNETVDVENTIENSVSSVSDPLEPIQTMDPQEKSTQPKILVVDDVVFNRKLLSKVLKSLGVNADTSDDGLQAVQMCDACKYSLILMDVFMPVMDGVEACVKIKSKNPNKNTPVVFVSANVQSDEIARCEKGGGSQFVPKPVSKATIVEVLAKHCSPEEKEYVRRYLEENV